MEGEGNTVKRIKIKILTTERRKEEKKERIIFRHFLFLIFDTVFDDHDHLGD